MSGACCYDFAFERTSDQGEVSHNIHEFVARGFVVHNQGLVLYESEFAHILALHAHKIGKAVKLFLRHWRIVYDHSVIKVTAFYKIAFDKRFYLANKYECAARSHLFGEVFYIFKTGVLVSEYRRVEVYHNVYAQVIIGQHYNGCACFFIAHLYFLLDNIEILFRFLFHKPCLSYLFAKHLCAAVKYRHFGTVDFDKAVVYTGGIQRGKGMLACAYRNIAFRYNGASRCRENIFSKSFNYRLSLKVCSLKLVTEIVGSGVKLCVYDFSGVKTFAIDCERSFECYLFHIS